MTRAPPVSADSGWRAWESERTSRRSGSLLFQTELAIVKLQWCVWPGDTVKPGRVPALQPLRLHPQCSGGLFHSLLTALPEDVG